jgi:hypothetical protein
MARSVDHQICFRLADAVPAAPLPGPLRLGDAQAEALSELLQVFACGEESAALAFARLGNSFLEEGEFGPGGRDLRHSAASAGLCRRCSSESVDTWS